MTERPDRARFVWRAPVFGTSGFGDEARGFALGLDALGLDLALEPIGSLSASLIRALPERERERLEALAARTAARGHVLVTHNIPLGLKRRPGAAVHVGRVMFETDGLPPVYVARCNLMDELWVPSSFNVECFARAGVRVPLHCVPEGVDTQRFRPELEPFPIPGARGTRFLSIFDWSRRKGWDVLLRAWALAFHRDDDVCLVLRSGRTGRGDHDERSEIDRRIDAFLTADLSVARDAVAPIVVLGGRISDADYPRLFAGVDAYVSPTRGEGWGRPLMEAMSCGRATIATRWSGQLDFMNDGNSLLIDVEGLETVALSDELAFHRGGRWAAPSAEHLAALLQRVAGREASVAALAARARHEMLEQWDWTTVCKVAAERFAALEPRRHTVPVASTLCWDGPQRGPGSEAHLNRQLWPHLARHPAFALAVVTAPGDAHSDGFEGAPSAVVTHSLPMRRPRVSGPWIVWHSRSWRRPPRRGARLWEAAVEHWVCDSRQGALLEAAGIPKARIRVLAPGVSTAVFSPSREPPGHADVRFLVLADALRPGGVRRVLSVYADAFSESDPVCLQLLATRTRERDWLDGAIERFRRARGAPRLERVESASTDAIRAERLRQCDVVLHDPDFERASAPLLEALACGVPVVDLSGAATTNDFPASLPRPSAADPTGLRRWADREEASARGRLAREFVVARRTLECAADNVAERFLALRRAPGRVANRAAQATPGSWWRLSWSGLEAIVACDEAGAIARAARLLDVACVAIPAEDAPPPDILVRRSDWGWQVRTPQLSATCPSEDDLVASLACRASDVLLTSADSRVLHAAAVRVDGGAALFVGDAEAGKTSLAEAAWRRGLGVIGDDAVLVDAVAGCVAPFARPLKLRLPERALPDGPEYQAAEPDRCLGLVDGEHRLLLGRRLPAMVPADAWTPVSAVFLLSRPGRASSRRLPHENSHAALAAILRAAAMAGPADMETLRFLRKLWTAKRIERLEVGENDQARALDLAIERVRDDAGDGAG